MTCPSKNTAALSECERLDFQLPCAASSSCICQSVSQCVCLSIGKRTLVSVKEKDSLICSSVTNVSSHLPRQEYLKSLGNSECSPQTFLENSSNLDKLLIIIQNEDIAAHVHKVESPRLIPPLTARAPICWKAEWKPPLCNTFAIKEQ